MVLLDRAARVLAEGFLDDMAAAGHPHSLAASRLMGVLPKEGLRPSELADRLGITKQSVGQLVDDLEHAGYVVRRPDPSDGRARLVVFGPRGHDALPAAWAALRRSEDQARAVLGDQRLARVREALEAILAETGADPATGG